jgi:hypothetical protein
MANKTYNNKKVGVLVTSQLEVWKDVKSKVEWDVTASMIVMTNGRNVLQSNPSLVKDLANGHKLDQRFSSNPDKKKWKDVTKDSKLSISIYGNLMKLKMLQHSTKEEGVKDYEGAIIPNNSDTPENSHKNIHRIHSRSLCFYVLLKT